MPERSFPPVPASVRTARSFARLATEGTGAQPDVVALLVSEVTTNVVRHAATEFTVEIEPIDGGGVRVAVSDGSSVQPAVRELLTEAESGLGLHILDALAVRWGTAPTPAGKQVWFEVAAERAS